MILKEIRILSEALWESAKTDLKFFSPIQSFIKNLSELSYLDADNIDEAALYVNKIEDFFESYRDKPSSSGFYFEPPLIRLNDESVKKISALLNKLKKFDAIELNGEIAKLKINSKPQSKSDGIIFIGHGRSKLWARLQLFIKDDLGLKTLTFEEESRTSETIVNILSQFLDKASFAILIMTSEDETVDGNLRARQNVIHEAGLFQGRLGFDNVIILKEDNIEEFSNISGLQYISFAKNNIEQTFYELQRKFKKMGMIK
ncbi:TIR domain-containing protein [Pedobacter sp. WC2423]|uniref:TIR domain-containing protein n=1 Tax=Pedobacter sp. WC2423 TaxID=3234142 RepID=UPI00346755A4